jgi:glycosyltransferase involved in cell wall biosynthesis
VFQALKLKYRSERVDLVTTYDPLKTGFIGIIIARLLRTKFAPEVNGVYTSPAEWLDVPDSFEKRIKMTIFPRLMKFVLGRSDGIKLLYDTQIDPFGYQYRKNKIIRHFPCFVPIEHFRNISEEKEILFVGFPFFRKGVDILIKAFKRISDKYIDWNLKILGWFPNKEELRKAIDNHPRIYHQQPVPYNEMAEHIGSCGIFVLPSRSEAMGRVLVEAMAAGKPRIGAMVDGIPTVINDGIDGVLFKCEDIDDLAAQLDLLMGDAALRTKLGKAGELRAKQEFDKDVYFANLAEFYYAVMENNGSDALKCREQKRLDQLRLA